MARRASLSAAGPRAGFRLVLLLAGVLLAHLLALEWFAQQRPQALELRPLPPPMFTRLLQPQAPPPAQVQEQKQAVARVRRTVNAIDLVAQASTPVSTRTQAPPEAPVPAPEPAPEPEPPAAAVVTAAADTAPPTATTTVPAATATAAAPVLDSWPADTRLSYVLSGRFRSGDLHGNANVRWQREGSRYQARVEINLHPWISQVLTSQGEVTAAGLYPEVYEERRSGKARNARLSGDAITLDNGRSVPRPPGVQDTASQFVELSHRFSSGLERLEVGQAVSFWMARPGAVDLWTYDVVERETLRTAQLGEIEAFRLKPRPIANPRGNITAEMWFAPSLQYLPVRIRVSMGDEAVVDLLVDTIEQR